MIKLGSFFGLITLVSISVSEELSFLYLWIEAVSSYETTHIYSGPVQCYD
jgi:hypothetical protein